MKKVTIYFNPECSKCNSALHILNDGNCEIEIRDYLTVPPTREEIQQVLSKLKCKVLDITRTNDALFIEKFANKEHSEEEWLKILIENPILLQRPIVITGNQAVIGRPPEKVIDLLNS